MLYKVIVYRIADLFHCN